MRAVGMEWNEGRPEWETESLRNRGVAPTRGRADSRNLVEAVAPVRVCVRQSSLGHVLVGQTDFGVRLVLFGDDEEGLRIEARRRCPQALRWRDAGDEAKKAQDAAQDGAQDGAQQAAREGTQDERDERAVAAILREIEMPRGHLPLPLHWEGTAFQRAVWTRLMDIPLGQTRSYGVLAREMGRPGASRAVARACAENPLAVLVPCHRVVAQDGSLAGYRWGVSRKRELLARERAGAGGAFEEQARSGLADVDLEGAYPFRGAT